MIEPEEAAAASPAGESPHSSHPSAARDLAWRVLQFPLTRIVVAAAMVLAAMFGAGWLVRVVLHAFSPRSAASQLVLLVPVLAAATAAYTLYVHRVERRPVTELSLRGAARELAAGALLGSGLFVTVIGCLWLLGCYHVNKVNPVSFVVTVLAVSVSSGYNEEILTRAILFRIMEEPLGTAWALASSGALFGLLHWSNPHSTVMSTLGIALAGVLLGAAYALTRRLWLAAGLHFAWNFTQGGIFGVPISGTKWSGLLDGTLTGPPLLTGGAFGPEASLLVVLLCAIAASALLVAASRKGQILPPAWRRPPAPLPLPPPGPPPLQ